MAIHCDVCGSSIFSAQENYNVFEVDSTFISNSPGEVKRVLKEGQGGSRVCCAKLWHVAVPSCGITYLQ